MQEEDEDFGDSKVHILKKKFKKLDLLRTYYNVNKEDINKKFDNPVDEYSKMEDSHRQ